MPTIRDERFKEEVVEAYLEGTIIKKIVDEYEVSTSSIYRWLGEFGFERQQHRNRVYTFNEDYFEHIDTENKAYWLGVLASQGALLNFRNTVKITASEKKQGWLNSFLKAIDSTDTSHKITGSRTYYASIRSRKIFDDLKKLGVSNCKPLEFYLPTGIILMGSLEKEYIRGWEEARAN